MLFVDTIEILSETISLINQLYLNYNQIYFSGHPKIYKMNKTFPWELQIWDIQDEEQNKKLHSAH